MIKDAIRQSPVYDLWYKITLSKSNQRVLESWRENGQPLPPPHVVKQIVVKEYARRFSLDTFIETGTYYGDMVYAVKNCFKKIYSIELSEQLASYSKRRFKRYSSIEIIQGDSADVLPSLQGQIDDKCLIWLDAHYSGSVTARGRLDTPIVNELDIVFANPNSESCVLIDDARCFTGQDGYPSLAELESQVKRYRPGWAFENEHDIIRIHPK